MVVWTPSQWERELDNFAARVRAKDYDRIPYQNWQTVFGFTKLNPSKKIILAIDSTGKKTVILLLNYRPILPVQNPRPRKHLEPKGQATLSVISR